MKTKVISISAFVCLMACALSAYAICMNEVKGNGKVVTREYQVPKFHSIALALPAEVEFFVSDRYSCEVTIDENLIEFLDIKTDEGELELKQKRTPRQDLRPTRFVIKLTAPSLDEIDMAGSGNIVVLSELTSKEMDVEIAGSGDVKFTQLAHFSKLEIDVAGSGDVVFDQLVSDRVDVDIAGSGDVNLNGQMRKAEVEIAGSGDVSLYRINDRIKYNIIGSGNIFFSGSATISGNKLGSGCIIEKR